MSSKKKMIPNLCLMSIRIPLRWSASLLAIALFSLPVPAQISLVHATPCGPATFPGTACTVPATGAGHLIVVGWQIGGGVNTATTITGLVDNAGNAYQEAGSARAVDTAAGSVTDIWYARNSLSGATSITITPSSSIANAAAVIWEFSGVNTLAPLDQTAVLNSQSSTAAPSGAAVSTTAPGELAISLAAVSGQITGLYAGNSFAGDSLLKGNGWAHFIALSRERTSRSGRKTRPVPMPAALRRSRPPFQALPAPAI